MIHLKELPIIIDIRKLIFERKFSHHLNVNYFRGVYNNFAEAIEASPDTKPIGYDNKESAKLYKERTKTIYPTDYPVLFWMDKYKSNINKVFDFGGHVGIHYYSYSKYLDFSQIKKWTICDVKSVVDEARILAAEKNSTIILLEGIRCHCNSKYYLAGF